MSNVTFTIGGRRFTVACAAGEEAHVEQLGETIDARVAALGGAGGQSETRMLLFAALMLADEVHEQRKPVQVAEPAAHPGDDGLADRLLAIATSLENLASRLEAEPNDAYLQS